MAPVHEQFTASHLVSEIQFDLVMSKMAGLFISNVSLNQTDEGQIFVLTGLCAKKCDVSFGQLPLLLLLNNGGHSRMFVESWLESFTGDGRNAQHTRRTLFIAHRSI